MATTGIAAVVKTPGLSPVKTRLAARVGRRLAGKIYRQSLRLTAATLREACVDNPSLRAYWAVAEADGVAHPFWRRLPGGFPVFWTGDGDFGTRLHRVYAALRRRHRRVVLIGADSPQLGVELLNTAVAAVGRRVIGPATDGGFYLFAAEETVRKQQWCAVEYGGAQTRAQFLRQFAGRTRHLPPLTDIDDEDSLAAALGEFSPARQADADTLRGFLNALSSFS